ncbi:Transferrin receptor-like, dimerization domain [Sesbania bispinosa]|nr:Transferrin receptor-like, dimerization domain [Sesbania bispinosa]
MIKSGTVTVIAIATSYFLLLIPPTPKSNYHSLFISTSLSDNASISHHLETLTRRPHIAGSEANAEAAAYVLSVFNSCSIQSHVASYEVALSYPVSRSLVLTNLPPEPPISFNLIQETYEGDPYADVANEVVPTFHAYAKSGTATGPVVYVNYGRVEDYLTLKQIGINVSGTVVLARHGKIYRGDIVQNAYDAGAVGMVIYSDRKEYGGAGKARWFPDDKWLPPSGVQVGTVYGGAGDPTTPGWASSCECERLSKDEVEKEGDVPLIPSLPVSAADGEKIMRSIGGPVAEDDWQGSKDAPTYRVGPGPGILNLSYTGQQVIATIQNVIGVIEGAEEPDRFVILGNHRDAWTFGAVDPNSGTAALLEIGSTEWVEENREILASRAVAYLNADCVVGGPGFNARATPQLDELIKRATQQHVGIPAADIAFGGDVAAYPVYHSLYDDFMWMEKFGDPMFQRHVAAASVWGLVALWLADEEFLPFDYLSYAKELQFSAEELEKEISNKDINLSPIFTSIKKLEKAAIKINNQRKDLEASKGWITWKKDHLKVRELNDRLMMAERAFTDRDGLFGMSWYKHLVSSYFSGKKHSVSIYS